VPEYALEILLLAVVIAIIAPIGVEVLVAVIPAIGASPWDSFLVYATIVVLVLAEAILLLLVALVVLSAFGDGEIGAGIAGIGVLVLLLFSFGHVAVAISGAGGGEAGHTATHGSAANTTHGRAANTTSDNQDQTSWALRLLRILYGCPVPTHSIFWPGSAVCK